jgi:hypothetical protein
MKTLITTTIILLFTASALFAANCWYNGKEYPPGTVKGTKVCSSKGYWR